MDAYKKEFIEFMVDCQVLKFGDFVTKSGRKTPFFVNTGFYRTAHSLESSAATMQRLSKRNSVLILMFSSDLHTRVFRFLLPLLLLSAKSTIQIFATAQTVKRLKTTEIRVFYSAVL